MTSWDFFDTLCGRRTGHEPWRLFDCVGGEEFRKLRQLAETRSDKTWSGIWRAMAEITSWPSARLAELEAREWQAEREAAFPIAENVRRVAAGDRIVSDCYFSTAQVRELADLIGIPNSVKIVTSWDGKWTGRWWQTPAAREPSVHIGDNHRSDFLKPKSAGIASELYVGSRPTKAESDETARGRWAVAAAMRTARLQGPHEPGSPEARYWVSASQANVRFLLLATNLVRGYVEACRPRRVLFVTRDTLLLQQAYAASYDDLEVGTFYASRETLRRPSPAFVKYVRSVAPATLFVDLHGTGRTVAEFSRQTGIDLAYVFVCGQRRLPALYPRLVTLRGIMTGTAIEVMNYDVEGRVLDVVDGRPARAQIEYDASIVSVHRAATLCGVESCCEPPVGVTPEEVSRAAEDVRVAVCRELLRQHQVEHPPGRPAATAAPVVRRGIRR